MKKFMKIYTRLFVIVNAIYMIAGLFCGKAVEMNLVKNEKAARFLKGWNEWTILCWKLWLLSIINLFKGTEEVAE